jgi:hypothetical protein
MAEPFSGFSGQKGIFTVTKISTTEAKLDI